MSEQAEARSPFLLLDEVEAAKEFLVLSYTANLDFFERFALAHARALGALVTLISDASMVSADPMVVRRAGTAYLDARAICLAGAFHPKLVILVGDDEARIGIGSGNLTMAGWHGNAEMWTVLRSDRSGGPDTLRPVAHFLRRLADSAVTLSPGAPEALTRVASRLDALPASEPGPRLIDNLNQPIIDGVPKAAVDELCCYAPFHDAKLAGLSELIDRLSPKSLAVYVQPQTSVDGRALETLLRGRSGELRWISDERYHHGKLVEWTVDGRRWTLTGSPNLSRPALLTSVADGGNCELGLLAEVDGPRVPGHGDPPLGAAAILSQDRDEFSAPPGILLLGALRMPGAVRLILHRPLDRAGRVQRYDSNGDGWRRIATVEAGESAYDLEPAAAPTGQAVRIVLDDGQISNEVFVADLARVRRPQMSAVGKVRSSPQDVAIHGLGTQLLADIDELRGHLLRVGALVPTSAPDPSNNDEDTPDKTDLPRARPAPGQSLEDYVAACDPVLGREMTEFALVLPALPGIGLEFDETMAGLDTDADEEAQASSDEEESDGASGLTATLGNLREEERERWRRWVERLVGLSPNYPMVVRTLALRSFLHGMAEGVWEAEQWPALLADATRALGAPGDEPTEDERAAAGSLGAIALALQRNDVQRFSIRDEQTMRYEAVASAISPLLPYFDPERVERLAAGMPEPLTGSAALAASQRVVGEVLEPPTGSERSVRLLLDEHDIGARVSETGVIELTEPLRQHAQPLLLLALGLARDAGPLAVRGTIAGGAEVVAVWDSPLLVIERRAQHVWGRLFRLPPSLSPLNFTSLEDELPRPETWMGQEDPPAEAARLLRLGLRQDEAA